MVSNLPTSINCEEEPIKYNIARQPRLSARVAGERAKCTWRGGCGEHSLRARRAREHLLNLVHAADESEPMLRTFFWQKDLRVCSLVAELPQRPPLVGIFSAINRSVIDIPPL